MQPSRLFEILWLILKARYSRTLPHAGLREGISTVCLTAGNDVLSSRATVEGDEDRSKGQRPKSKVEQRES